MASARAGAEGGTGMRPQRSRSIRSVGPPSAKPAARAAQRKTAPAKCKTAPVKGKAAPAKKQRAAATKSRPRQAT